MSLDSRSFAYYESVSASWVVDSGQYDILIGASCRDIRLERTVTVESERGRGGTDGLIAGDRGAAGTPSAPAPGHRRRTGAPLDEYWRPEERIHAISDTAFEALLGRPIPTPSTARPFHANSTIGDIRRRLVGRYLRKLIRRSFGDALMEGADEVTQVMAERMLDEMPLRTLALFSGGRLSFEVLDGLLLIMNGRFFRGLRTLSRARREHPEMG